MNFKIEKIGKKYWILSYKNRCKLNCRIRIFRSYLGFALMESIEDCSTLSSLCCLARMDWIITFCAILAETSELRLNDNFKISSLKFANSAWMALALFSKPSYGKIRKRVIFTYNFCWFERRIQKYFFYFTFTDSEITELWVNRPVAFSSTMAMNSPPINILDKIDLIL